MTEEHISTLSVPQSNQTLVENLPYIACYTIGWYTLYFATGWISRLILPQVKLLKYKEQMFWQLACVRAVCGMLTLWGGQIIFLGKTLDNDHSVSSTDESWLFCCIIFAFLIFEECTLLYFDWKYRTFSKELHLHHILAFNNFFLATFFNRGHYYFIKIFLLEASTPCSCICWCLIKLKLQHTTAWKVNQWILINIFHWRTAYEMWGWYEMWRDWNTFKTLPLPISINIFIGITIVSLWLTPYWTYKKTVQFFNPVDWNIESTEDKKRE